MAQSPWPTTLGSARWADVDDLYRAGMVDAKSGLILGRAAYGRRDLVQALKNLFDKRVDAETACRQFVRLFRRSKPELVRLSTAVHSAVFSPSGGGKGVSCVLPFLLTTNEACFVLDVKDGELARITAEARRKMGRRVHIIDPYHCVTDTPAALNPVQSIDKNSPYALDDSRDIAAAIVTRDAENGGDTRHFLDNAESAIAAAIATVVELGEGDQRSLQAVCDIMSSPKRFETAVRLMIDSAAQQGMLSRMGGNLLHLKDRELASTMSTIARFLRFLSTPAIAASTRASSFDPNEILDGNTDVYCVLPSERVATLSPLLRLWTGTFLRIALRAKGQTRINFICDEAGSSLGKMDELEKALTVGRSAGIKLLLFYQDLGQLKKCWPDGADQTLLANVSQTFFGVNDPQTADFVSSRLGDETLIVTSGGSSTSESVQTSPTGQPSTTRSRNWNDNWQQQARRLLKPEEVAALSPRTAITFTPGMPPISTTLVRYYEERLRPEGRWKTRSWSRAKLAADCISLLLMAVLITAGVIAFKEHRSSPSGLPSGSYPIEEQPDMPFRLPGGSQPMKGR